MINHTFGSSNVEGCVAIGILDVQVASSVDEGLCGRQVPVGSCIVEASAAVLGLDVQVAASLDELLNHLQWVGPDQWETSKRSPAGSKNVPMGLILIG